MTFYLVNTSSPRYHSSQVNIGAFPFSISAFVFERRQPKMIRR